MMRKINKLLTAAIAVMGLIPIIPVYAHAEETSIINTVEGTFSCVENEGVIQTGRIIPIQQVNNTKVTSPSNSSMRFEYGNWYGAKVIFNLADLKNNAEFIKSFIMVPSGYFRDPMKNLGPDESAIDTGLYPNYFLRKSDNNYYAYDTQLKRVLVSAELYPDTAFDDMTVIYDGNSILSNTAVLENENGNDYENAVHMVHTYTENEIAYMKGEYTKNNTYSFSDAEIDITDNIKNILLSGGTMAAYNVWPDAEDTNYYSTELRSVDYIVEYYTPSEFLENLKISDNTASYIDFVLSDDEMLRFNSISKEAQNSIIADVKAGTYADMQAFADDVLTKIDEAIENEYFVLIKEAIETDDHEALNEYILVACGNNDGRYIKFENFNNKSFIYNYIKEANVQNYGEFAAAAKAAIDAYTGDNLSPEDIYDNTVTLTVPKYTSVDRNNSNLSKQYTTDNTVTTNYGHTIAAKLVFSTEFIKNPEMVKSVKVTANVESRDPQAGYTEGRLSYLVPTVADSTDASLENMEGDKKYYSDPYNINPSNQSPFTIENMDITDDVLERMQKGEEYVAYNLMNGTTEDWKAVYQFSKKGTFVITVTYKNDYDFNNEIEQSTIGRSIKFACGDIIYNMYEALDDKAAINEEALRGYETISEFGNTLTALIDSAYLQSINVTSDKQEISDAVLTLLDKNSDEYKMFTKFKNKDQITESLTAADYDSTDSFKNAAITAINEYKQAPADEDKLIKSLDVFKKDANDTSFMYLYQDGNVYINSDGEKTNGQFNVNADMETNSSMKLLFEDLEIPMSDYVKSASLKMTVWTGTGDAAKGADTKTAYTFITKTTAEDTQVPFSLKAMEKHRRSESNITWNDSGEQGDYIIDFDITEDILELNGSGSLYYMLYPEIISDDKDVAFRFRNTPTITAEYMNNYDLYEMYKTNEAERSNIIDAFAFINDITLTQDSQTIANTIGVPENLGLFESKIRNYKLLEVTMSEITVTETGYSVDITNNTDNALPIFVAACAFGENNKMLSSKVFEKSQIEGSDSFSFDFEGVLDIKQVKVFCWSDSSIIKPYCPNKLYIAE